MLPCAADQRTEPLEIFLYYLRRASMTIPASSGAPEKSRIASARSVGAAQGCHYGEVLERYGNWNSIGVSRVGASVILSPARWSRAHHLLPSARGVGFQYDRAIATRYESPKARYPTHRPDKSLDRLCSRRLGHMISFIFPAVTE